MTWCPGTTKAIARSLDIYYRDTARTERMDRLNATLIRPGQLAFDIGAHVGDRTASYCRLGASVVAIEPQPSVFRALRLLHGRNPEIALHCIAVGAQQGRTSLLVNSANPTVSTLDHHLVTAAPTDPAWSNQVWDQTIETPVTTLDQLIVTHGRPDLVKIDVEGYEAEALRGLSHPVRTLVVEFTTLQPDVAIAVVNQLQNLGTYRYNFSLGEKHALACEAWVGAEMILELVTGLPAQANSGDIYAVLQN